jgi:hypothetical protein
MWNKEKRNPNKYGGGEQWRQSLENRQYVSIMSQNNKDEDTHTKI